MPLNLNTSFKRRVSRKRSEKCTWKTHFDACAREVAGALELLAKNRADRFVFARVDPIVKMCNNRGAHKYSKRMVEEVLRIFRELKILSDKITRDVDGVEREGRFFNPHDRMTTRYPQQCVFIGAGKKAGTWSGNGIWQPGDDGAMGGLVVEDTTPESTPNTTPVVDRITGSITGAGVDTITVSITDRITGRGVEDSQDTPDDLIEFEEDTGDAISEPLKPLEPSEPGKPIEPPQPPDMPREARPWLSWLWMMTHQSVSYDEPSKYLALRPAPSLRTPSSQASPAGRPGESPDVTLIEEWIAQETYAKKEIGVMLAWSEFCLHHKHDPTTLFPVTVFKTNYQTYRMAAMEAIKRWKEFKQRSNAMELLDDYLAEAQVTPNSRSEVSK